MRNRAIATVVVALTMPFATACGGDGPNEEARKDAVAYNTQLQKWASDVTNAGDDDKALGAALDHVPDLPTHDDVDKTPEYLAATAVASRVDVVATELQSVVFHPELKNMAWNIYQLSQLYNDTLSASTKRLRAFTAAADFDAKVRVRKQLDASSAFAETRIAALTDEEATIESASAPSPLGDSMGAFMADWVAEEKTFQSESIEHMSKWSSFGTPYKDFWWFANFTELPGAVDGYADVLRAGYVEQIPALAGTLDTALAQEEAAVPNADDVPAPGEPYREALRKGYRPWNDAKADQAYTLNRLWLLWRIRELEKTPEKAYSQARATLLEEINRKPPKAKKDAQDPRSGAARILDVIGEYSDVYGRAGDESLDIWLASLTEIHEYGVVLADGPATPAIGSAFDDVLSLMAELNKKLINAVKTNDADGIVRLGRQYQKKIVAAAEKALGDLDDDAVFKKQLADAIAATAP